MALSLASRQAVWYEHAFKQIRQSTDIYLYCAKIPIHYQRTKHIDVHYHYIRELIHKNCFILHHIPGDDNIADLMYDQRTKT